MKKLAVKLLITPILAALVLAAAASWQSAAAGTSIGARITSWSSSPTPGIYPTSGEPDAGQGKAPSHALEPIGDGGTSARLAEGWWRTWIGVIWSTWYVRAAR